MKTSSDLPRIAGIIVSFKPDIEVLRRLVEVALDQVDDLVIVDNGTEVGPAFSKHENLQIISLGDNFGIAAAQNLGIARARALGASHVLLLDQDSLPGDRMVASLLAAMQRQEAAGIRVACVGPNYRDERHGNAKPFVRLKGLRFVRQHCEANGAIVEVDFLIASGCLVPLSVLDEVGPMVDELFIDYVDIEWCLRASSKGYRSFGVCSATMGHALGDTAVKLGGRVVPVHTALRQYYNVRNAVWLCQQSFVSSRWRMALAARLAQYFIFYGLFAAPRLLRLGMMMRGFGDGLFNRMGKYRDRA